MLYITGITGHSGHWLIERLVKEEYKDKIRCVVREDSDTSFLDKSGLDIEKVVGDLNDINFLRETITNVDTLLHIVQINLSTQIVDVAIKNGVKWVILIHTTGRYSQYKSASAGYIKIEEDIIKRRNEIGITILRPTMIYGSSRDSNMYSLINYLYKHKLFPLFGKGSNLMQPVHARDLGNSYYDVIANRDKTFNKSYNLSGAHSIKYIDLIKTISNALNIKNIIIKIPLSISLFCAFVYNKVCKTAIISYEQVLRMKEDKAFEHTDATNDFGYSPISFELGILEEVDEYLSKQAELPVILKVEL